MKNVSADLGIIALRRAAKNKYRLFKNDPANPNAAGSRISQNDFCGVSWTPKFTIDRSDRIFTMGSCFAREVEEALIALGANLSLENIHFPEQWFDPHHASLAHKFSIEEREVRVISRNRAVMNRYSVHSMLYDFQRVLENRNDFWESVIMLGEEIIYDPQVKNLVLGNEGFARQVRAIVDDAIGRARISDVFIMTLGMTESWRDRKTGAVLGTPPSPQLVHRMEERFEFFNASHCAVSDALTEIRATLSRHAPSGMRIILTVSPVPIGSTFMPEDVVSANSYSKATLVSVAREFAARYEDVDYFPSYEMIMHSPRNATWFHDQIHVRPEVVKKVMSKFLETFFKA